MKYKNRNLNLWISCWQPSAYRDCCVLFLAVTLARACSFNHRREEIPYQYKRRQR